MDSTKKSYSCQEESAKMSHTEAVAFNKAVYRRVLDAASSSGADDFSDKTGIGRTTVYEWQRGIRIIPQKHLEMLADKYQKPLAWFYCVEGDEQNRVGESSQDKSETQSSHSYPVSDNAEVTARTML